MTGHRCRRSPRDAIRSVSSRQEGRHDEAFTSSTSALPRDIVEKLNRDTTTVLGAASMQEMLARIGAEPMPMTAKEFSSFIGEELAANEALIKSIGLKPI
jgi:hypothetical protein